MIKKFLKCYFRFVPPFLLLLLPIVVLYGHLFPWPTASAALSNYPSAIHILIGQSSSYSSVGGTERRSEEKTYLIFGDGVDGSKTVTVTSDSTHGIHSEETDGGLLVYTLFYISLIIISWFAWFGYKRFT
jgi:hypothetical protein